MTSTQLRTGIPRITELDQLKQTDTYRGPSDFNTAFLARHHDALKKYGMFLADNGSDWYLNGAPDERWDNDTLVEELGQIKGSDFEAVDESGLMVDPDSGQAQQP